MTDKYWYVASNANGFWNTAGGNWYFGTGGTGGAAGNPGIGDNAIFDANSGVGTCTVSGTRTCYNLIMSGWGGTITGSGSAIIQIYGDTVTLSSSGVFDPSNNPQLQFYYGSTTNLTTNGQSVGIINILNNTTLVLQDDLIGRNNTTLYLQSGTLDANNKNVTIGIFSDNGNTSAKTLNMGSGTWNIMMGGPFNNIPNVWDIQQPANMTLNASTSRLRFIRATTAIGLYSAINSTDTTITLVETSGGFTTLPPSGIGTILIDNEQITYTGVSGNSLTGCTRGVNGTIAASHSVGTAVLLYNPAITTLTNSIADGSTTADIVVNSTGSFETNGYFLIDNEIINFGSKLNTTTFSGIVRAQGTNGGTTGAAHNAGATVREVETRRIYFGAGLTYNIVEFDTQGNYIWSYIETVGTINTLTSNSTVRQFLVFNATPTVSNFNLVGASSTGGNIGTPIGVYYNGTTPTNISSTVQIIPTSTTNPQLTAYTYTGGDPWDFFELFN